MKVYLKEFVDGLQGAATLSEQWTAVIPAAGRGTRLGYHQPKILYPVAGRPILDWLIDLLGSRCSKLIFVLSPEGAVIVEPEIARRLGSDRWEIVVQAEPKGMADAVFCAVPRLQTIHTFVIWGDQVAIQSTTVQRVMKLHQAQPDTVFTLPLVQRENPYVHYVTDLNGYLRHILERREGAEMPPEGEADCGVFAFRTERLCEVLQNEYDRGVVYSQNTKEWNFLPLFPHFESGGDSVTALRLDSVTETIGVNEMRDAELIEHSLRTS